MTIIPTTTTIKITMAMTKATLTAITIKLKKLQTDLKTKLRAYIQNTAYTSRDFSEKLFFTALGVNPVFGFFLNVANSFLKNFARYLLHLLGDKTDFFNNLQDSDR